MPVEEIELELNGVNPTPEAVALIADVDRMIDAFDARLGLRRNPNYIPTEPIVLYRALADVTRRRLPPGRVFCELGSGYGLAACLAAQMGYDASGVEIDPELVEASRALSDRHRLDVRFLHGSYFPEGYSSYPGQGGDELVKPAPIRNRDGDELFRPRFDGMDCDTDEIDLFFVYPWPKEHEMMRDLFESIAGEGAILLAYYGDGEICAYRKLEEDDGEAEEDW